MTIEDTIFTTLKSLVGNRCYPDTLEQSATAPTWPAIRYSLISEEPDVSLCGDTPESADPRFQIDCIDMTKEAAVSLRASVKAALATLTDPPAVCVNSFNDYDADTKTYRASIDVIFYPSNGT